MSRLRLSLVASVVAALGGAVASSPAHAQSTWLETAAGTYSWQTGANWSTNPTVPNATDAVANLTNDIAGDQIVTLDAAVTLGTLGIGDGSGTNAFTLAAGSGGPLTFGVSSGSATLSKTTGGADTISTAITLASPLSATVSTGTLTLSGGIGESGGSRALTKLGTGTLLLSGANSFTGGTTVSAGTLQLGNGTTSSNLSGTTTIQSDGVLEVNNGTNFTLSSPLAGGGLLRKTGSGTVTMSQASGSFTGNVEIAAGTVSMTSTNTTLGQQTSARTITVAAGATLQNATNNPFGSFDALPSSIPTLLISGTFLSTTAIPTFGNVTLSGGTVDIRAGGTGRGLMLNGTVTVAGSAKSTITGTSGTINLARPTGVNRTTRFIVGDATAGVDLEILRTLVDGGTAPAASNLIKAGPGTMLLAAENTFTGTVTVEGGTLQVGNGSTGSLLSTTPVTFGGSGRLSLEQAPDTAQSLGALTFSAGAGTVASVYPGSGTTTVTFGSLAARAAGATGNFGVTGGTNGSTNRIAITGATADALLGPGYFFNGSNYAWYDTAGYVRGTTVGDAGFVTAPAGATFGTVDSTSNVNVTGGITAQPTATVNTVRLADAVAANNSVTLDTGNTLALAGILKAGGNAGTIGGGTLTAATAGGELVVRSDAATDTLTISSVIANNDTASRLTTTGDGRVILLATNTHSGGTTVASGTLQLGDSTTSGNLSGTTTIQSGGVLEVNPSGTSLTLAGPLAGGGLLRKTGSGRVSVGQRSASFTGNVEIQAGTIRMTNQSDTLGAQNSARTITVAAGATLESGGNNPFGNNGTSPASIPTLLVSGTLLNSSGLATLGNMTLSGATLDTRGNLGGVGFLLNGVVTVAGSAKTTITGTSGTIGLSNATQNSLTTRFDVGDVAAGVDLEILRTVSNNYINSASNLIKAGQGTMLLAAENTFTGTVTVEAGTLLINGATNSASAMTVQAGGTLGGSGSIGTAITGAGTVSPGNSPGIFTATQFDGSGGLGSVFEFTGTMPDWSAATASVNDVLRLTDATTPFPASLSAASGIDILFAIAGLPGGVPVAAGTYTGGFFTDLQTDFVTAISGGDFRYWVQGTFGGTQQSFDGVVYSPLSAFDPSLSVNLATVPVTAGFAGGSISGQSMQLVVVPEPGGLLVAGVGIVVVGAGLARSRRRATACRPL